MYNAEGPTYTTVYGAATAQWTTASVSKNTVSGEVFWGFGTCTLHCRARRGWAAAAACALRAPAFAASRLAEGVRDRFV